MAQHTDFGKLAEDLAAKFLLDKGYKILKRNFRFQKSEIDIIAEYDDKIIIIEVKARGQNAYIEPHEAVDAKKIKRIVIGADSFLNENKINKNVRFDIISVFPNENKKLIINHLEDAFDVIDAN